MGARNWALGTTPNSGRKFAIQFRTICSSARMDPCQTMRSTISTFARETDDDSIVNVLPRPWGPIHCLHLPDDVLRKVYRENALALFGKR